MLNRKLATILMLAGSLTLLTPSPARAGDIMDLAFPGIGDIFSVVDGLVKQLLGISWDDPFKREDITELRRIIATGHAAAYSADQFEQKWRDEYTGYEDLDICRVGCEYTDFSQVYQEWSEKSLDSIKSNLKAMNQQLEQFDQEEQALEKIQENSEDAESMIDAHKVAHQIGVRHIELLTSLRETLYMQMQQHSTLEAQKADRAAKVQHKMDEFFNYEPERQEFEGFSGGSADL